MTQEFVVHLATRAIFTVLLVSAPVLLVGLIVGLVISIFQAATQIHEMTLTFIPKILVMFLTIIIFLPWMLRTFLGFARYLFTSLPSFSM